MVFLVMFGIAMSGLIVVILSHNAFAQPERLYDQMLYEEVKQASSLGEPAHIDVGDAPVAIVDNVVTDTVYVVNSGSNTISVISALNNTKIKDIPLGRVLEI
jgi:YVTN family beta-propeller protein